MKASATATHDAPPAPETSTVTTPPGTVRISPPPLRLSRDEMLARHFPDERTLARFVTDDEADEVFMRREANAWREPGAGRTLDQFIASRGGVDVRFSPIAWASLASTGPTLPLTVLCARLNFRMLPQPPSWPRPGVDLRDRDEAMRRVTGIRPAPTFIVDEGPSLAIVWRIEPIDVGDPRAAMARRRLADALGGDRATAEDSGRRLAFLLPGVASGGVFPRHVGVALPWEIDRVYSIDDFSDVTVRGGQR